MRTLAVLMVLSFLIGCGNDRIANDTTTREDPDIDTFQLFSEPEGIYGHWLRTDKREQNIRKYLTIDEKVILFTTVCQDDRETVRATAISKIEIDEDQGLKVKKAGYAETIAEDAEAICFSRIKITHYQLSQEDNDSLTVTPDGEDALTFVRVDKSHITAD